MRFINFLATLGLSLTMIFVVNANAEVKSYREWKNDKVRQAQTKIAALKVQIELKKTGRSLAQNTDPNLAKKPTLEAVSSQDMSVEKLERQLQEQQYSFEVANDLSVTDYFVGYLTKVSDKRSAFNEVATKLSAEEVAELMNAYANSVFGARSSNLPASAANLGKEPIK